MKAPGAEAGRDSLWSHGFYSPRDLPFLQSAITLDLRARPTKYLDTDAGLFIPAVLLEVALINNAGHVLPHG